MAPKAPDVEAGSQFPKLTLKYALAVVSELAAAVLPIVVLGAFGFIMMQSNLKAGLAAALRSADTLVTAGAATVSKAHLPSPICREISQQATKKQLNTGPCPHNACSSGGYWLGIFQIPRET